MIFFCHQNQTHLRDKDFVKQVSVLILSRYFFPSEICSLIFVHLFFTFSIIFNKYISMYNLIYLMFDHFWSNTFIFLKCCIQKVLFLPLIFFFLHAFFLQFSSPLLLHFPLLPKLVPNVPKQVFCLHQKGRVVIGGPGSFYWQGKRVYLIILLWIWHWKGKQQYALSGLFGDSVNVCCVLLPRASSDIALTQNRPVNVCATSTILKCVSGPCLWEKCCLEERELFWIQ